MRIYITGLGMVTAAGHTVEASWQSVLSGQVCTKPMKNEALSNWPVRQGGEIVDFYPAQVLPDKKLMKAISRQDAIGLAVITEALQMSQMLLYRDSLSDPTVFNERTGIFIGSPGNKYFQQYDFLPLLAETKGDMRDFAQILFQTIHPMWLLRILPNNVLAHTGILYQFKGPNHNVTNHAVGGIQACIEAYHAIKTGQIDRAVVAAYDIGLDLQALFYYEKLGLLSPSWICPFDEHHQGTVLADGAAAIIIESEASARARQATVYAEIQGGLSATACKGLFGIDDTGEDLEYLLKQSLHQLAIQPTDLCFIVTHGNGSKGSDNSEARALTRLFATQALPMTAFKWCMGHTLVASGIVDLILAIRSFQKAILPGIATLKQLNREACQLNITTHHRSLTPNGTALIINRGFASMNACLAIKAYEAT